VFKKTHKKVNGADAGDADREDKDTSKKKE